MSRDEASNILQTAFGKFANEPRRVPQYVVPTSQTGLVILAGSNQGEKS